MSRRRLVAAWTAALLIALAALWAHGAAGVAARPLDRPLAALPRTLGSWQAVGADQALDEATLEVLAPDDHLLRTYQNPAGVQIQVFLAYFARQREGRMIHSPRHCLPGEGWHINERRTLTVEALGRTWPVNDLVLAKNLSRLAILYWYQGRGRVVANEYAERALLIWDAMRYHRSDGMLARLTTPIAGGARDVAVQDNRDLAGRLIPALRALTTEVAGGSGREKEPS
ncbi:MAG: EpsI family protein [Deltaproteobacteria bacterium]|nr:EpsI family protein [Deltaproteobacteria bacterium]